MKIFFETQLQATIIGTFEQFSAGIELTNDFWIEDDLPLIYKRIWLKELLYFIITLMFNLLG